MTRKLWSNPVPATDGRQPCVDLTDPTVGTLAHRVPTPVLALGSGECKATGRPTHPEARARIRQQLLGAAVFARLTADASVADDEVERYYRNHLKGYERPATRRVRHILVRTRAQADELERKLRDGADFAELARRYSTDAATAPSGGVLSGGVTRGQTLPAFDRVAFSLKTNAISAPVRTPSGWEIIQATGEVTPGTTTPLSEVRSTIEAALLATKRQNALGRWAKETRTEYAKRVVYAPGFKLRQDG